MGSVINSFMRTLSGGLLGKKPKTGVSKKQMNAAVRDEQIRRQRTEDKRVQSTILAGPQGTLGQPASIQRQSLLGS